MKHEPLSLATLIQCACIAQEAYTAREALRLYDDETDRLFWAADDAKKHAEIAMRACGIDPVWIGRVWA